MKNLTVLVIIVNAVLAAHIPFVFSSGSEYYSTIIIPLSFMVTNTVSAFRLNSMISSSSFKEKLKKNLFLFACGLFSSLVSLFALTFLVKLLQITSTYQFRVVVLELITILTFVLFPYVLTTLIYFFYNKIRKKYEGSRAYISALAVNVFVSCILFILYLAFIVFLTFLDIWADNASITTYFSLALISISTIAFFAFYLYILLLTSIFGISFARKDRKSLIYYVLCYEITLGAFILCHSLINYFASNIQIGKITIIYLNFIFFSKV